MAIQNSQQASTSASGAIMGDLTTDYSSPPNTADRDKEYSKLLVNESFKRFEQDARKRGVLVRPIYASDKTGLPTFQMAIPSASSRSAKSSPDLTPDWLKEAGSSAGNSRTFSTASEITGKILEAGKGVTSVVSKAAEVFAGCLDGI